MFPLLLLAALLAVAYGFLSDDIMLMILGLAAVSHVVLLLGTFLVLSHTAGVAISPAGYHPGCFEITMLELECAGINLLREGMDLPEVALVAILDADREGFLRSYRSLIQMMGRAARNTCGKVILYADEVTESIRNTVDETARRRSLQTRYNEEHNITPATIQKDIVNLLPEELLDSVPREKEGRRQEALGGDLCLCRCTPPPQLVASQQTSWVEGDMAEGGAMHPTISADAWHVGMPPQAVTKEGHAPDSCDQRFLLRDEADGTPLAHRLYRLRHPGGMLQGRTDAQGHTERVTGTGGSQIRIEIFGEGA